VCVRQGMHTEEFSAAKAAVESQEVETCDRCGKPVPVMNMALHHVRCRGVHGLHPQDIAEATTERNINTDVDKAEKDGINNSSGRKINEKSPGTQWECRFCTFLNDQTDLTSTQLCLMCGNSRQPESLSGTWNSSAGSDERMTDWTPQRFDEDSDDSSYSEMSSGTSENGDNEDDDNFEELGTWTCSYCTVVNTRCERSCSMCDMPNTAVVDSQRPSQSSDEPRTHNVTALSLLQGMETALPALCYLGVTAGAMLTDTRGSSSRMRTGILSSLVGSLAGMAVAAYLTSEREESGPPPGHVDTRSSFAAERLPVHRFQSGSTSIAELNSNDNAPVEDDRVSCRICMENYEHAVEIKTLKCFHMFHAECIDEWLLRKPSCPLCCTDV